MNFQNCPKGSVPCKAQWCTHRTRGDASAERFRNPPVARESHLWFFCFCFFLAVCTSKVDELQATPVCSELFCKLVLCLLGFLWCWGTFILCEKVKTSKLSKFICVGWVWLDAWIPWVTFGFNPVLDVGSEVTAESTQGSIPQAKPFAAPLSHPVRTQPHLSALGEIRLEEKNYKHLTKPSWQLLVSNVP